MKMNYQELTNQLFERGVSKINDFLRPYNLNVPTPRKLKTDSTDLASYGMAVTPEGNYPLVLGHVGGYFDYSDDSLTISAAQLPDTDENRSLIKKYEISKRTVDYLARKYSSFREQAEHLKRHYNNAIKMLKNPLHVMVHELYHPLVEKLGIRREHDSASVGADEGVVEMLTEQTLGYPSNDTGLYAHYKEKARETLENYFGTSDVREVLNQGFNKGRNYLRNVGYRIREGFRGLASNLALSY